MGQLPLHDWECGVYFRPKVSPGEATQANPGLRQHYRHYIKQQRHGARGDSNE